MRINSRARSSYLQLAEEFWRGSRWPWVAVVGVSRSAPSTSAAGAGPVSLDDRHRPLLSRSRRSRPTPAASLPRGEFGLAASIREQGILQPLVVRRRGDGYELIIGERRWRASQIAGLDEVPAVILDASDRQVVEMALVENVQRADLNPMELAEALVLVDDEQMTQDEVGRASARRRVWRITTPALP
jgi:ParB family chromosome partitioning protein